MFFFRVFVLHLCGHCTNLQALVSLHCDNSYPKCLIKVKENKETVYWSFHCTSCFETDTYVCGYIYNIHIYFTWLHSLRALLDGVQGWTLELLGPAVENPIASTRKNNSSCALYWEVWYTFAAFTVSLGSWTSWALDT